MHNKFSFRKIIYDKKVLYFRVSRFFNFHVQFILLLVDVNQAILAWSLKKRTKIIVILFQIYHIFNFLSTFSFFALENRKSIINDFFMLIIKVNLILKYLF